MNSPTSIYAAAFSGLLALALREIKGKRLDAARVLLGSAPELLPFIEQLERIQDSYCSEIEAVIRGLKKTTIMTTLPIITTYTRCRHNPGDTFIGAGLQYVCEWILGEPIGWQIVSKFRPEQLREAVPDMQRAGLVLYAGTPQYNNYSKWIHHYDDELWREIINPNGIHVAVIAGGSGEPDPTVTAEAWAEELASDPRTVEIIEQRTASAQCFTVRDRYSKALLDRLGIGNILLPCTAIFAPAMYNVPCSPCPQRVGIVSQGIHPNDGNAPERVAHVGRIVELFERQGFDPVVICHYRNEFDHLKESIEPHRLFYANDFYALLKFYGTCEGVVSYRLHGSLPAWGVGCERVVNVTIDSRGYAVEEAGIKNIIIPDDTPEALIEVYQSDEAFVDQSERRQRIQGALNGYKQALQPILEEWRRGALGR